MTIFVPEPHLLDSPRGREWPQAPEAGRQIRAGAPPATADVVVVGAGPAGLAVVSALWHLGVRDVVVLDRAGRPCVRFFDRIDALRQRVLRSPYWHHPGVEGYRDCELLDFARLHWARLTEVERHEVRMAQAGHRSVVPVDAFEAFCTHVAAIHQLPERTWRATVDAVLPRAHTVLVRGPGFTVTARFVVLCPGEERVPAPWWPPGEQPSGVSYWDEPAPPGVESVIVVGAGLSAAHLIANALAEGRLVHWVVRGQERFQCNDVNAAFFRAEGRARFGGVVPWADRLALMRRERRASIMFEFRPMLSEAQAAGRLIVYRGAGVAGMVPRPGDRVAVELTGGGPVTGDHVILALGTTPSVGAGLLPVDVVAARDGWPDLDARTLAYRNAPRVFAVGAAAGMVLGPAARNIDGHRVATARVATTIATSLPADPPNQVESASDEPTSTQSEGLEPEGIAAHV